MARLSKKAQLRAEIRQNLLDQLDRNGTVGKHYIDLVEDYMRLYDIKLQLDADVKERGAKVTVYTAKGDPNIKTNESIMDALKVNQQMLKILDSLKLDPAQDGGGGGGTDDRL